MKVTDSKEYNVNKNVIKGAELNLKPKAEEIDLKSAPNGTEKMPEEEPAAVVDFTEQTVEMMKGQLEGIDKSEDAFANYGKMMEIARRIARGDRVPATDEKKLMEFDEKIYQMAKMQGMMAENRNRKKHESLFDEEKDEMKEQMRELEREALGVAEIPQIGGVETDGGGESADVGGEISR